VANPSPKNQPIPGRSSPQKPFVGREPYKPLCVAGLSAGGRSMPTSEYFRRQADLCLRLSLIASDEVVSTLLIAMSRDYQAKADALSQREVVAIVAQETSPDRDTHGV
jgi:hypothetical protein